MTQFLVPIAFLVFNRPDTTIRVFEEIRRVQPLKLLVVADGPRGDIHGEADKCQAVRSIIDSVDWPCEVLQNYSETNLGCKMRVSTGLDWVFEKVEEAIVLEDDCLPHPDFFKYCEEMLKRYRHDERIMMVSGSNYMFDKLDISESYFFSRVFSIWGWATWRKRWQMYDVTMKDWSILKCDGHYKYFYPQPFMRKIILKMFDDAYYGRIDTWDIQWVYTCLFNNGLSVIPRSNLISNIGYVGLHAFGPDASHNFPLFPVKHPFVHPNYVYPNYFYDDYLLRNKLRHSLFNKIFDAIVQVLLRLRKLVTS